MAKVLLMNFGDGSRIVYNETGETVEIGIGKAREVELNAPTLEMIQKAQSSDTLLLVPITAEMPAELTHLLAILQSMDAVSYEEILQRTNELLGPDNMPALRPSHGVIRSILRDIAVQYSKGVKSIPAALAAMAEEKERKRIKDDVDPRELEREAERLRPAPDRSEPPAPKTQREKMDDVLGIVSVDPETAEGPVVLEPGTIITEADVDKPTKRVKAEPSSFKPRKAPAPAKGKKAGVVRRVKAG
jgi:hypothetical protein